MEDIQVIMKAFNDGYLMQKHNPTLAVSIAKAFDDPSHSYAKGFIAGSIECIKERGQAKEIKKEITKEQKKSIERDI